MLAVPIFCSPGVLAIVIGIVAHPEIHRVNNDRTAVEVKMVCNRRRNLGNVNWS